MKKTVKVKPNSKKQAIVEEEDGSLTVHLKSPPVDGKANKELIEILAKNFGVTKSQITIQVGLSGRNKLVNIEKHD
jgi:uncharacterized protein (TIGR00251 family)